MKTFSRVIPYAFILSGWYWKVNKYEYNNTHGDAAATSPIFHDLFVELWERFGYYGVQGVLAVFFVKQLGFSQEQAFVTFGAFAALVYGLISIGGYVGDHLLGTKRTIVLGALVLAIGYFMTGLSLLKPDLIFIAPGLSLSVTACLKLTQPACFRSAIRRKIRGLMAHLPCSICRSTSAR